MTKKADEKVKEKKKYKKAEFTERKLSGFFKVCSAGGACTTIKVMGNCQA